MRELLNEPAFIQNVADRGVRTKADAITYIRAKIMAHYAEFGFGFYLVELKESLTPVGMCGLVKRETLENVDIGFAFLQRFWGKGYAYESAAAVMDYGRSVLGLDRIVAVTARDNPGSRKLLERLGLKFEKMIDLPGYEETRLFA